MPYMLLSSLHACIYSNAKWNAIMLAVMILGQAMHVRV